MLKALAPWRPVRELSTIHDEIDSLFGRFLNDEFWGPRAAGMTVPAVESFYRDDELVVRADLPGIDPKEIELTVEGDRLTIKGERRETREGNGNRLHREVMYGRFERMLPLPAGVDASSVKASYHDGVLEVTMKAPKEMATKKVPISVH